MVKCTSPVHSTNPIAYLWKCIPTFYTHEILRVRLGSLQCAQSGTTPTLHGDSVCVKTDDDGILQYSLMAEKKKFFFHTLMLRYMTGIFTILVFFSYH